MGNLFPPRALRIRCLHCDSTGMMPITTPPPTLITLAEAGFSVATRFRIISHLIMFAGAVIKSVER
jgi:hypothetical protein